MKLRFFSITVILVALCLVSAITTAEALYRITLLRATPGSLATLIKQTSDYKSKQNDNVSIMRHSQGDHWDLMLLEPAGKNPLDMYDFRNYADFQHSFLAKSKAEWHQLNEKTKIRGMFHIEMFHALHGKADELLKQRKTNVIFYVATQTNKNSNINS